MSYFYLFYNSSHLYWAGAKPCPTTLMFNFLCSVQISNCLIKSFYILFFIFYSGSRLVYKNQILIWAPLYNEEDRSSLLRSQALHRVLATAALIAWKLTVNKVI